MSIKKVVAREILIILGIVLLGGILLKLGELGFKYSFKERYWQEVVESQADFIALSEQDKKDAHIQYENEFKPDISWSLKHKAIEAVFWSMLFVFGRGILFLGYPIYLFCAVVVWAIKTVKNNTNPFFVFKGKKEAKVTMAINFKKYALSCTLFIIYLYFLLKETGCSSEDWTGNLSGCGGRTIGVFLGNIVSGVLAAYIYVFVKAFLDALLWGKKELPDRLDMVNFILYSSILISAISSMGR